MVCFDEVIMIFDEGYVYILVLKNDYGKDGFGVCIIIEEENYFLDNK